MFEEEESSMSSRSKLLKSEKVLVPLFGLCRLWLVRKKGGVGEQLFQLRPHRTPATPSALLIFAKGPARHKWQFHQAEKDQNFL